MKKNWYNILPWATLLSGTLVVMLLAAAIIYKPQKNIENTVNRKIALDKLKTISLENKELFNTDVFSDYVYKTLFGNEINTIWLIAANGEIVYAKGEMAQSTPLNSSVNSLMDDQSKGLINAVEESIDPLLKLELSIAAAIRREGEHNDVYGHLVLPVMSVQNELAGFVGVAYSLNNSKPSFGVYAIGISLLICFLIYWLSMPLWVYFDSRKRNDKSILWTLFVFIGNLPAYIAYLILRK
jgi:hypothetical protein